MKRLSALFFPLLFAISCFAQNQNLSNGVVFDGEPFLAIDPANGQHMVVGWMGFTLGQGVTIKTRTTFNGGQSWSAAKLLPHFQSGWGSADPSMAFGPGGKLYLCYIDSKQSPPAGNVYVLRSDDGGLTWGNPSAVINVDADGVKYPIDRPWLAVDRSGGPNSGNLYVTTKPAPWVPAPNRPYFMRSTDGGASWSAWAYLDAPGYLVGNFIQAPMAVPTVAADGTLYIMYPSYVFSQNVQPGLILAKSTNGGASFSYHYAYTGPANTADTLAKLGYVLLADPSYAQHLAFVLPSSTFGDYDAVLLESTDGGANWLAPQRVNDDPLGNGKMQDLVWGGFDQDGDLAMSWRDRRAAPGTGYQQASEIWGAVKWKNAAGFSPNFRVSDVLADYNDLYLSQSGNDFMGVGVANDTLAAVWGDVRDNKLNIYFQRKALNGGSSGVQQLSGENLPEVQVTPNPARDFLLIKGSKLLEFRILDSAGQILQAQALRSDEYRVNISRLPAGPYFIQVNTGDGNVALKFVKE